MVHKRLQVSRHADNDTSQSKLEKDKLFSRHPFKVSLCSNAGLIWGQITVHSNVVASQGML